jgi:putative toxin-antitoxin system antitoxin component (TIGR02293 family)
MEPHPRRLTSFAHLLYIFVQLCHREAMTAHQLAQRLGGTRTLKRRVQTEFDLLDAIGEGLPIPALETVIRRGMVSAAEIYDLVIPRRTLAHRKDKGQPLSAEQSDRLTRVVRMAARAEEAIGDAEGAARWLRKPNRALEGKRPLDLLESDLGARMVERVLGRIEHGLAA